MPCAIAISSPIFSPSQRSKHSPIFCKPASSPPPPPPSSLSPSPLALRAASAATVRRPFLEKGDVEKHNESPSVLKRKRPAMIRIPVVDMGVESGPGLDPGRMNEMVDEGDGYSLYCKRGRRGGVMEDRYSAVVGIHGDDKKAFFGVFDGHGGTAAAEFAAKNLDRNVMEGLERNSEEGTEEAVKEGYLTTDAEFLKEDVRGGACCVTALIQKGSLVVSNVGDCRAVMSRGGVAEALTVDHRPSREDERERIESLGGYVDCCNGVWRVHGSLAVSRAIGDRHLKQWVIAEPVTKSLKIDSGCEFLILASDGLWDKVSNQEAVDIVHPMCVGLDDPEPFSACKKLVDLSVTRGCFDDISVMVIQLGRFIQ